MSPIQPIDIQVNLQQTSEVSRVQQNEITNPLVQREETAEEGKKIAEENDKRVQENPDSQEDKEVTEREAGGGPGGENPRRRQKKKKEKEPSKPRDPDRGNILDITT